MRLIFSKILLVGIFLITTSGLSWAEEKVADFTPETKEFCNEVIINIYKDILKVKDKYPGLRNFDEKALFENQYGIYSIIYKEPVDEAQMKRSTVPFEFGVTIDKIQDTTFAGKRNSFNLAFPLLGVKFTGYQTKRMLRTQFDVMPLVNEHGTILSDYQQKFMPLRLTIRTLKDIYKVRQPIEFEVVLKNVSKRHMVVKSLGMETLFFLFGDMAWGTNPSSGQKGGRDVVLKAGESVSLKFQGESFEKPHDIEIYCAYRMSVKGVNPSGTLRIKVVEDQ